MFTLSSAAVVAAAALIVPLALKLVHLRLPSVVVEIIAGILVGPQLLAWAKVDEPVGVLSTLGLAFLLMLSGLEIEFERLRGQVLKLTGLAKFGLEAILGAFLAGATLKLIDRDEHMRHTLFRAKLQAVGFGVFVPFFFISTGMALDVRSLEKASILARVPVFLAALLIVRALPALFYRPLAQRRAQLAAAGLLQATSLSIPVVAGSIGVDLGLITPANYVALVAAGLLSVLIFPLLATTWLQTNESKLEGTPV